MFKQHVFSAVLAAGLVVSTYLCFTAYQDFRVLDIKADVLDRQMDLLKDQETELERQKKVVARINGFTSRAATAGLTRDNWVYYPVRKREPAVFEEVARILNQSATSDTYYFKPVQLHIVLREPKPEESAGAVPVGTEETPVLVEETEAPPFEFPEGAEGDLLLSVKGSFVVRRE